MTKDNDNSSKQGPNEPPTKGNVPPKGPSEKVSIQKMVVQPKNQGQPAKPGATMTDEELLAAIRPKASTQSPKPESKPKEETVMSSNPSPQTTQEDKPKPSKANLLGAGALAAVVLLSFWTFSQSSQLSSLQQQLQESQSKTKNLDETMNQWQVLQGENAADSKATLAQVQEQIQGQVKRLDQLGGRQDWKLYEAQYLIVLASERLQAFGDAKTAKVLLTHADDRIKSLVDPNARLVREAIAKDLSATDTANSLDVDGLWAKLGALSTQLETLEFFSLADPKKMAHDESAPEQAQESKSDNTSGWRHALSQSWEEVKGLVKVREFKPEQLQNLLTQGEQQQLMFNLKLLVEDARWAVLYRNQTVYDQSLQTLSKRINDYFVKNNAFTQTQNDITSLEQVKLKVEWPDYSQSLLALDKMMSARGLSEVRVQAKPQAMPQAVPSEAKPVETTPVETAPDGAQEPTKPVSSSAAATEEQKTEEPKSDNPEDKAQDQEEAQ